MATHQAHLEWNSRFLRIAERRGCSRVGHRHHDIRLGGSLSRERAPLFLSHLVHVAAVNLAVGGGGKDGIAKTTPWPRRRERVCLAHPPVTHDEHLAPV